MRHAIVRAHIGQLNGDSYEDDLNATGEVEAWADRFGLEVEVAGADIYLVGPYGLVEEAVRDELGISLDEFLPVLEVVG